MSNIRLSDNTLLDEPLSKRQCIFHNLLIKNSNIIYHQYSDFIPNAINILQDEPLNKRPRIILQQDSLVENTNYVYSPYIDNEFVKHNKQDNNYVRILEDAYYAAFYAAYYIYDDFFALSGRHTLCGKNLRYCECDKKEFEKIINDASTASIKEYSKVICKQLINFNKNEKEECAKAIKEAQKRAEYSNNYIYA